MSDMEAEKRCREAFEVWFLVAFEHFVSGYGKSAIFERFEALDGYRCRDVDAAWKGWQARGEYAEAYKQQIYAAPYTQPDKAKETGRTAEESKIEGLEEDLRQLIRVALTNPTDLRGFIQANYPKEYAGHARTSVVAE